MTNLNNAIYDRISDFLDIMGEDELEALAEICQARAEGKREGRREALRQELMANLQQAIGAILGNGFTLTIMNTYRDHRADDFDEVYFSPKDVYSIRID